MTQHLRTPLVLSPVLIEKPWGGRRLYEFGRHGDPDATMGESWDVADLPAEATSITDPVSRIIGGPWDGRSLGDVLLQDRHGLLGRAAPSAAGRFPLLVKVLDAAENLSVQVHPPRDLEPLNHKTESWIVLTAETDAELLLGLREGVSFEDVRAAAGHEDLIDLLRSVSAHAGDVIHVPAGTIHALGAGVVVAEVQTPSDTTHRLWDWPDQRDGGRELHTAAGLEAVHAGWEHNLQIHAAPSTDGMLIDADAYTLHRSTLARGEDLPASTSSGVPRICLVLAGGLEWSDSTGQDRSRTRTESVLLPAASTTPLSASADNTTVLTAVPT